MLGWNFPQHTFIRYGALNTVEQLSRSAARVRSFSSRHYGDHQNPILKGVARASRPPSFCHSNHSAEGRFFILAASQSRNLKLGSTPRHSNPSDKRGDSRLSPNAEFGEMSHTRLCCGGRIQAAGVGRQRMGATPFLALLYPAKLVGLARDFGS